MSRVLNKEADGKSSVNLTLETLFQEKDYRERRNKLQQGEGFFYFWSKSYTVDI
jgi:hypothetical protein